MKRTKSQVDFKQFEGGDEVKQEKKKAYPIEKLNARRKELAKTNPKANGGRPGKSKTFIEAFKKILENNEFDVIIMTDNELLIECNNLLDDKDKISNATFDNWKNGVKIGENYEEFVGLYKRALNNQKRLLFEKLQNDDKSWQRYAWIIERKFDQWNLRTKSEEKVLNVNVNIDRVTKLREVVLAMENRNLIGQPKENE